METSEPGDLSERGVRIALKVDSTILSKPPDNRKTAFTAHPRRANPGVGKTTPEALAIGLVGHWNQKRFGLMLRASSNLNRKEPR